MRAKLLGLIIGLIFGGVVFAVSPVSAASPYQSGYNTLEVGDWEISAGLTVSYANWSTTDIDISSTYLGATNNGTEDLGARTAWLYWIQYEPEQHNYLNLSETFEPEDFILLSYHYYFDETDALVVPHAMMVHFVLRCMGGSGPVLGYELFFDDDGSTTTLYHRQSMPGGC